jgi:hypothetical protein
MKVVARRANLLNLRATDVEPGSPSASDGCNHGTSVEADGK